MVVHADLSAVIAVMVAQGLELRLVTLLLKRLA
jgi:hypothetical protein